MISIILDVETTGLLLPRTADIKKQPRIIELAFARIEDGKVVSEHEWLLDPECELPAIITKITGVKPEDLVGKPKFREILGEVEEAISGADQLITHNAPFDTGMLITELELCARTGFPWPETIICTVAEHMHLKGRRLKLTELYEMCFDRKLEQKHRALDDVRALVEICIKQGIV